MRIHEWLFFTLLKTLMSAVLPFKSVTSMPTVRILGDPMFVPAKLDLLETEKLVPVREFKITKSLNWVLWAFRLDGEVNFSTDPKNCIALATARHDSFI